MQAGQAMQTVSATGMDTQRMASQHVVLPSLGAGCHAGITASLAEWRHTAFAATYPAPSPLSLPACEQPAHDPDKAVHKHTLPHTAEQVLSAYRHPAPAHSAHQASQKSAASSYPVSWYKLRSCNPVC